MTREEADARIQAAKDSQARRACEAVPLPDPAAKILGIKAFGGTFYAATDRGVYVLDRMLLLWNRVDGIPPEAKVI